MKVPPDAHANSGRRRNQAAKPIVLVLLAPIGPITTQPVQSEFPGLRHGAERRVRIHGRGSRRAFRLRLRGRFSRAMDRRWTRKDAPLSDLPPWRRGVARHSARDAHDLMILNGFFRSEFTIPALAMRTTGAYPAVADDTGAARRVLGRSARLEARAQARIFARARGLGLLDDVRLHATSEQEADEIRDGCPWARDIVVAPNIRALGPPPQAVAPAIDGRLRIVFLAASDRKKNLDYAIKLLANVRAPVTFDIFGPRTTRPIGPNANN